MAYKNYRNTLITLFLILFLAIGLYIATLRPQAEAPAIAVHTVSPAEEVTPVQSFVPARSSSEQKEKFGQMYTVRTGGKISFSDELVITLKTIEDSRCKPGVQCIWAGELNPIFEVTGGTLGSEKQEIRLGTLTKTSFVLKGYTFNLKSATENSADIVVSK